MHRGNTIPVVIISVGFCALLGVIYFMIPTNSRPFHKVIEIPAPGRDTRNQNYNVNINVVPPPENVNASNTNTDTTSTKESTDVVDSANKNLHTYTSYKLGVQFSYVSKADEKNAVLEKDNRIYVYYVNTDGSSKPLEGQWVEVHSKDISTSLTQAITTDFLSNVSPSDCFAEKRPSTSYSEYPAPQTVAQINFPHSGGLDDPSWNNRSKCPLEYSVTNGLLYFWDDGIHKDRYAFFSIGQYAIMGLDDTHTTWQDTLHFIES